MPQVVLEKAHLHTNLLPAVFLCSQGVVSDSAVMPWTVARQAALYIKFPKARILQWLAISFSRGSFWPRDQIPVSCIAGKFFTAKPPGKPTSCLTTFTKKTKMSQLNMIWHSSFLLLMLFWILIHTYPFISHFFPTVPILRNLLHLSLSVNKLPFFPLSTLLTNWPNINFQLSLLLFQDTSLSPSLHYQMLEIGIFSCCRNHPCNLTYSSNYPFSESQVNVIFLRNLTSWIWNYSLPSSNTPAFHMYPFSWSIYSPANIIDICVHILFLPIGPEALWVWKLNLIYFYNSITSS